MGIALVTGGTSGIGAEFARALAARGHDLVLVARSTGPLDAMATELRATGREVEVIVADLADPGDTERVAQRLRQTEKPVDILVNNAGFGLHSKLRAPDVAEHERAIAVMIRAVLVLSAAALEQMEPRRSGTIINVGSVAGEISLGGYSAIKGWVRTYTESLSNELRGSGVTVTDLMPGWVHTEFHRRADIRTSSIPEALWIDAGHLVEACLRDVDAKKVLSIPTVRFKVLAWFTRHLPRSTMRSVSHRISLSRSSSAAE
ncbi:SDR family NAD(P)-dependent oxidoreductase [Lysinimonas soli]|uniref:SDR family NAD(P)-dependent oxidoreductase n=1 Tax=Lysinimonas soli TaxID=1074233 RepID=A0ABW0NTH3_9MICO